MIYLSIYLLGLLITFIVGQLQLHKIDVLYALELQDDLPEFRIRDFDQVLALSAFWPIVIVVVAFNAGSIPALKWFSTKLNNQIVKKNTQDTDPPEL